MTEGRGGFWNRAARRSGGNRPRALDIVVPEICACGAELYAGLLERRLIHVDGNRHEIRLCPGCPGCRHGGWQMDGALMPNVFLDRPYVCPLCQRKVRQLYPLTRYEAASGHWRAVDACLVCCGPSGELDPFINPFRFRSIQR